MIYHMWLNKPCLDEDVYQIAGLRREIAKKAAVICINAETQREAVGALRAYCIDELNMKDVTYSDASRMMQAFMIRHRPIAEYFNSGAGVVMMRIESEIIVRIIRATDEPKYSRFNDTRQLHLSGSTSEKSTRCNDGRIPYGVKVLPNGQD